MSYQTKTFYKYIRYKHFYKYLLQTYNFILICRDKDSALLATEPGLIGSLFFQIFNFLNAVLHRYHGIFNL